MSIQSDAAKKHIEKLLNEAYPEQQAGVGLDGLPMFHQFDWKKEYRFSDRLWRFDYAVPSILCANPGFFDHTTFQNPYRGVIELDGGTFKSNTGHNSGVGLRKWREKNNAAMAAGWRVWHYAPEEIIKAGRKIVNDILIRSSPHTRAYNPLLHYGGEVCIS